jgi:hypothetical protein
MTQALMIRWKRAWRKKEDRKATPCVLDPKSERKPSPDGKLSQPVRVRKKMGRVFWGIRMSGLLDAPIVLGRLRGIFDGWTPDNSCHGMCHHVPIVPALGP